MKRIKLPELQIGQTVYVNRFSRFTQTSSNLSAYIIFKINTKSFYAVPAGDPNAKPVRFDKRKMFHSTGFGYCMQAYRAESEYWKMIQDREEKTNLRRELEAFLYSASLEQLQYIKNAIAQYKKERKTK